MKPTTILISTVLITLISCTGPLGKTTSEGPESAPDKSSPIVFSIDGDHTKGLDPIDRNSILEKYGFGVFSGYSKSGSSFDESVLAHKYFSNLFVNKDSESGKWLPLYKDNQGRYVENPTYWPICGSLSFFAYAPYFENTVDGAESALVMPSTDYEGGMLRGTYAPQSFVSNQPDFCLAAPRIDRTSKDGTVDFNFRHVLTRVRLYMNGDGIANPNYKYRVTNIKIKGIVRSNNFTYSPNEDIPCIWDDIPGDASRDGEYELDLSRVEVAEKFIKFITDDPDRYHSAPDSYVDPAAEGIDRYELINATDNGRLYLLPQNLVEGARMEVTITIYVPKNEVEWMPASVLPPIVVNLPLDTAWEPCKTLSYLVTLKVPEFRIVELNALVEDWKDSHNIHETQLLD